METFTLSLVEPAGAAVLEAALTAGDIRLARMFKALANPVRLAIIRWLSAHPQCITGDIVRVAGLAQSTVSQHLAVLRDAGLVCGTVDGPATCYCVDADALAWFGREAAGLVDQVRAATAACICLGDGCDP